MLDETAWQKCFKVSHTFGITKAMFVPIFYYYFVLLYFPLMNALFHVNIN